MKLMNLKDEVLSLPVEDRLSYALDPLDRLSGGRRLDFGFDLTMKETQLLTALNKASPRMVTKEALHLTMYGDLGEVGMKIIDVFVCKIRAKMKGKTSLKIETVWGQGYRLPTPLITTIRPTIRNRASRTEWTKDEDEILLEMKTSGSELWAIAEELERSERAIIERLRILEC